MDNNIFNNSQSLKLNDKSKSLVNQFNYNYNLIKEQIGKVDNLHSELSKIYDQIFDERTLKVYKENFKLTEKSISYDQFVKLASEK